MPAMEWRRGREDNGWTRFGLVLRGFKALTSASIFYFLALPLVTLATCSGPNLQYTGYDALRGVSIPAAQVNLPPGAHSNPGPDWWIAGIIVLALVGIGSAWRGGLLGSVIGLVGGIAGLIVLQPAIGFFEPPPSSQYWTPEAASGGNGIGIAFFGVIVTELGALATRSFYETRADRHPPSAHKGEWYALGCLTSGFLVLIGIGILALLFVLAVFHH